MSGYGYRLFTFSVFRGMKLTPMKFEECDSEHYRDITVRLLNELTIPVVGDPPAKPDEPISAELEAVRGKPAIRVEKIEVIDNTIRAIIWVGKVGSHEKAMSHDGSLEEIDISDRAAINEYRVIFAFPERGTTGVLAVESIRRSCPVTPLVKWLRYKSREEAHKKAKENGATPAWWRPKVYALADELRLAEMIEAGHARRLVLVKKAVNPGRTRDEREYEIRAPLKAQGKVAQVASLVRRWAAQAREDDGSQVASNAEAARQLAAIVSSEIKDLDLDDGWVELSDPDDQVKRVNPSLFNDVFTYKLADDIPPVTPTFYNGVRTTALRLQDSAKLAIDWPVE
ncbi:hypothetical protein [Streptomyces chartreusis]|uniref:hypothetical protein n=1 Tax=Streptomyces chartreusis TaxID=1969 RepID=UPI003656661C